MRVAAPTRHRAQRIHGASMSTAESHLSDHHQFCDGRVAVETAIAVAPSRGRRDGHDRGPSDVTAIAFVTKSATTMRTLRNLGQGPFRTRPR